MVEFQFYSGFAPAQKQKSIRSMHDSIRRIDDKLSVLEISTKSENAVGVLLSAFNLRVISEVDGSSYPLENVFQSSKVFVDGGPYREILYISPKDAKRDERLRTSGSLVAFDYSGVRWESEPKSMFYDYLYISALAANERLSEKIMDYDAFTDIEFNHQRSINCQARSAAIFVSLRKLGVGVLEKALKDKEFFRSLYDKKTFNRPEQLSLL
jgi:type I restriction enzyme M protein